MAKKSDDSKKKLVKSKTKKKAAVKKVVKKVIPRKKTTKKKADKTKTGRPAFQFTEAVLTKIENWSMLNSSKKSIAEALGMTYKSFNDNAKLNPEITAAYDAGKAKGIISVSGALYKKAMAGDVQAEKFYLSSAAPDEWSDKQTITGAGGKDLVPKTSKVIFVKAKK